jgi:tetratricopeptide (TPR) repeat protein
MALQTIEALCQQARQAIAERNWEKARQAYLQALGLKSDSADIHQGLATVCFQLRDLQSAAYHFKEVTHLDPLRAGAYINLGAVYNLLDQLDDAVTVLRRAIQLDPQRAEGYYNLGLVYRRKGQTDLAVHAYREAVRVNPRLADAHYNLGNLFLEKEQYRQAIAAYQEALKIRPDWDKPRLGLQQAQQALEEQETAEQAQAAPEEPAAAPTAPAAPPVSIDPPRVIDPEAHGVILSALHKATIDAENQGRTLLELATNELEPAVKELSSALVSPDVSISALDACLQRFEQALLHLRNLRNSLSTSLGRVRTLGDQFVTDAGQ